jgi:signal transduction histidine kinase/CheY-like chemotaxis protein
MTPPLTLFQGGRAFTTYYPVPRSSGPPAGYVNGVFLIDTLVRGALSDGVLDRFDIALTDAGEPVFGSAEEVARGAAERVSGESVLELLGRRWRMHIAPKASTWSAMRGDSEPAFLLGGIALAAGLSLLTWVALLRAVHRREAAEERRVLEARLEQSRKLEAMGQLAGGVAHDFNNMITAILGNAGLARRAGGGEAKGDRFLQRIEEACGRASELTTQLLAFSRNQVVEEKPLDLAREIERQRALFAPIVRDDVRLVTRLDPRTGVVLLGPGSLSQVLMNLLVNAVQAMPQGGELRLASRAESRDRKGEPGPWAVLSVSDDGVGMSGEVKARVFEPFYTTKPNGEGTGLGLSTVFVIANRAGGSVEIDSAPGRGTTVEIWLPTVAERAERAPDSRPAHTVVEGTVLLVEDDSAVLDATAELLRQSGLKVIKARHGREAGEIVAGGAEFDVVVTDAIMAHVGGLEFLRNLRAAGVRVGAVVCSGYSGNLSREDLEEVDAVFVPKPYSVDELLDAIEERIRSFGPHEAGGRA